jgi:putative endonuclease
MRAFTYILECADGTLYTGYTTDIEKRLATHNSGKASKYTRCRLPVRLVYLEECKDKEAAMSREWHIKQLSRVAKLRLIEENKVK